jgi:EAL domain-containing protein (putative c-di-GMP-specific phosphodiesterase class I)
MHQKSSISTRPALSPPGAHRDAASELKRSIEDGELVLHYQPRVSLFDRKIIGFEALVRWNHPRHGLLEPGEFIPVAEETSLINPLGRWVLEAACRQMAAWHESFPRSPLLTVSVNTSMKQLMQPDLIPDVRCILAETRLRPECLRLEITERSIIASSDAMFSTLRQLSAMNIGLEVDDFGTGYSSCNYLRELPFNTLKIDTSFVKALGRRSDSSGIISAILRFAGSLGIDVTAEGVEARHQFDRLTDLGCRHGQGYYFSGPVDPDGAATLIQRETQDPEDVDIPRSVRPAAACASFKLIEFRPPSSHT